MSSPQTSYLNHVWPCLAWLDFVSRYDRFRQISAKLTKWDLGKLEQIRMKNVSLIMRTSTGKLIIIILIIKLARKIIIPWQQECSLINQAGGGFGRSHLPQCQSFNALSVNPSDKAELPWGPRKISSPWCNALMSSYFSPDFTLIFSANVLWNVEHSWLIAPKSCEYKWGECAMLYSTIVLSFLLHLMFSQK